MSARRRWRWAAPVLVLMGLPLLLTAGALAILWQSSPLGTAAGVLQPLLRLGLAVPIVYPLRLGRNPEVVVDSGSLRLVAVDDGGEGFELELVSPHLTVLPSGNGAIDAGSRALAALSGPLATALQSKSYHKLRIVNASASFEQAFGHRLEIAALNAQITLVDGDGGATIAGDFMFHGDRVGFDAHLSSGEAASRSRLLSASLRAPAVSAEFDGTLSYVTDFAPAGSLQVTSPDLSKLATWLGLPAGEAWGAHAAALSGKAVMAGGEILLDQAELDIGGTRGTGNLTLSLAGGRPTIDATIDVGEIDVTPLAQVALGWGDNAADRDEPAAPTSLRLPWLQSIDADLRLSATAMAMGTARSGRAALTLTARSGRLIGDIIEIELYGGRGAGQFEIAGDAGGGPLRLDASITDFAVAPLMKDLGYAESLSGTGDLSIQLASAGASYRELTEHATGRLRFDMAQTGTARGDVARLMRVAQGIAVTASGVTQDIDFDEISLDVSLRDGRLAVERLGTTVDNNAVYGSGIVRLSDGGLRLQFTSDRAEASSAESPVFGGLTGRRASAVVVEGTLRAPEIGAEAPPAGPLEGVQPVVVTSPG